MSKKRRIKSNDKIIKIAIFTSVIAIALIGFTTARYFSELFSEKKVVSAENFYFSSNYLTEESDRIYTISNYSAGDEIIIEIYNYEDALRYTSGNITYAATSNELSDAHISQEPFSGSDLQTSNIKITLNNSDFTNGKTTFTIYANATSPYRKTISATFNVHQEAMADDAYMTVVDSKNSYVVTSTVTTEGMVGEITVNHPEALVPDVGDDRITEKGTSFFKFQAEKNSIYEFILFKENLDDIYAISPSEPFQIITEVAGTERIPTDALLGLCDSETVRNETSWGSYDKYEGGGDLTYVEDENGNIGYESKVGSSMTEKIPVTEPVNDYYSISTTIKVDITANTNVSSDNLGGTVVAISPVWGQQISWISVLENSLKIYSYQYYSPNLAEGNGFKTIDITEYNNKYLNIIVTGRNSGETNVYLNGELSATFSSGTLEFQNEPELTIGDLRPGRELYFRGIIYNFVLYNKVLSEDEVQANWNYYRKLLNIQ